MFNADLIGISQIAYIYASCLPILLVLWVKESTRRSIFKNWYNPLISLFSGLIGFFILRNLPDPLILPFIPHYVVTNIVMHAVVVCVLTKGFDYQIGNFKR